MAELSGYQLVEMSGENASLPPADVLGSVRALGGRPSHTVRGDRVVAIRPSVDSTRLAARLALSRYVGEVRLSGSLEDVRSRVSELNLSGRRFRLRVEDYGRRWDKVALEADIGRGLATTGMVDLRSPQADYRLVRLEGACLYEVAARIDRRGFEARKAENCPFFKPVTLHPKLSRTMVNLTEVAEGSTLLDPFCGTGSIVMEAALVGARALGSDLSEEMVEGAGENLRHFKLEGDLRHCDVGDIPQEFGSVDVVATDPPYGRSSGSMGEDIGILLGRAFKAIHQVLPRGGKAAICLPSQDYLELGGTKFRLLEYHPLRVHRSLVRYFSLFEKL